jgi:6-phosphogluconolactonase (cycloisomerase 2 family)
VTAFNWDSGKRRARGVSNHFRAAGRFQGHEHLRGNCMVHPNGKFLYASNRGDDSLAVFRD